jgi:glycosyltransferase involved in cell wall biosynthesis
MPRSIIYDITPFARRSVQDVGGIDRVAFAYGIHFAAAARRDLWGAYFGAVAPHPVARSALQAILSNTEQAWHDDVPIEGDPALPAILAWLESPYQSPAPTVPRPPLRGLDQAKRVAFHVRHWLAGINRPLPKDAIYLNVFNAGREHHFLFDWLNRRPDVRPVFFIHDLLPLDHPEYFPPHYRKLTERRLATTARYGAGFVTSSKVVRDRLVEVLEQRGRAKPPIHVAALPSPLPVVKRTPSAGRPRQPYFVIVGTIEPRKNHLLLLNLWRDIASGAASSPKLVAIGARGWKNEQVYDMFERCAAIRPHVMKVERVCAAALARLVADAQALLMPSFDEGYGLPVVEALTLGTPVIASDIPVFREITQNSATLLSPLNGQDWRDTILAFSEPQSSALNAARVKAGQFRAPNWDDYFQGVEDFLDTL